MKSFSVCLLCKKKPLNNFFGLTSYWFCKSCELAWKKQFPKAVYDETYYKGKSSFASKIFSPVAQMFYNLRESYGGNGKKRVWIDVGAGEGGFIKTVKAQKRIGVEVSTSGRKMMQESGINAVSDKQFLKSKNLGADIISFWHVLEHVENPWDYLKAAKRNLKKNGKIIIGIPNFQSLDFRFAREYWFHLQPQFHLWHFSKKSFEKILRQEGFSIDHIDYWSIEHHLTGLLQSIINKFSGSKENVLHKLIKRSAGGSSMRIKDLFWVLFWTTIGAPIVVITWVIGSVLQKSGTMIIVASQDTRGHLTSSKKLKG